MREHRTMSIVINIRWPQSEKFIFILSFDAILSFDTIHLNSISLKNKNVDVEGDEMIPLYCRSDLSLYPVKFLRIVEPS